MIEFCFDTLSQPVILCDDNGKIVYKNTAAKKRIPYPRVGSRLLFSSADPYSARKSGFVKLGFPDPYGTALRFTYKGLTALLISPLAAFANDNSARFGAFRELSLDFSPELFDLINGKKSRVAKVLREEKAEKLLASFLSDSYVKEGTLFSPKGLYAEKVYDIVIRNARAVLPKLGYRFSAEVDLGELDRGASLDCGRSSFVFLSLLLFALSSSADGACYAKITSFSDFIRNEFRFTQNAESDIFGEGLGEFIQAFPDRSFLLALTDSLCRLLGWRIRYSVRRDRVPDTVLYVDVTPLKDASFRESSKLSENEAFAREFVSALLSALF